MVMLVVSMIAVLVILFVIMILFMSRVMKDQVTSATSHLDELASEYAKKRPRCESSSTTSSARARR